MHHQILLHKLLSLLLHRKSSGSVSDVNRSPKRHSWALPVPAWLCVRLSHTGSWVWANGHFMHKLVHVHYYFSCKLQDNCPTTLPNNSANRQAASSKQQAPTTNHQPPTTKQCCSLLECLLHFTLLFLFLLFMCFVYGALTYTQTKGQVSCYGCFFIISYVTDLDIHIDIHAHNEMKRM